MSLALRLLAVSFRKQPQLFVFPFRRLLASSCVIFPQSHRHLIWDCPHRFDSARAITVNRPKRMPVVIGIRLRRAIGASFPGLRWSGSCRRLTPLAGATFSLSRVEGHHPCLLSEGCHSHWLVQCQAHSGHPGCNGFGFVGARKNAPYERSIVSPVCGYHRRNRLSVTLGPGWRYRSMWFPPSPVASAGRIIFRRGVWASRLGGTAGRGCWEISRVVILKCVSGSPGRIWRAFQLGDALWSLAGPSRHRLLGSGLWLPAGCSGWTCAPAGLKAPLRTPLNHTSLAKIAPLGLGIWRIAIQSSL